MLIVDILPLKYDVVVMLTFVSLREPQINK